jgi:hypothetical protein
MELYNSRHGLDCARYLTSGAYAVHASLKMAKSSIQLLTCQEKHLLWESSLRGGYTCVSERFAKSNQPGLEGYNDQEEIASIIFLDKNNLYGYGLQSALPVGEQSNVPEDQLQHLVDTIESIGDEATTGYFLSVDLE